MYYNPQCWKMRNYKKAVMIQDDKIRSALNYHRWKWHPSKEKMTCSRHHTTSDSSLLPRINPSGAFSWISFWPLLLLYCAAQAFFAAKRCIEDKKHTRRVLGHVNLFKSLVSEINLLHWLDNTAVLCTNYYCSDSSSRTKIWLDGAQATGASVFRFIFQCSRYTTTLLVQPRGTPAAIDRVGNDTG